MRAAVVLALLVASAGAAAAPDQDRRGQGAAIAATCAACHRLDGRATGIPPIIGIGTERLIAMMQTFKADADTHHIMHAVSLTLTDVETAAVADYLATLGKEARTP